MNFYPKQSGRGFLQRRKCHQNPNEAFSSRESATETQTELSPAEKTPQKAKRHFLEARKHPKKPNGTFSSRESTSKGKMELSPTEKPSIKAGKLFPLLGNIHTIQIFTPNQRRTKQWL